MADKALCAIPDCGKLRVNFRGWCNAHYRRWRRHGDPTKGRVGNYNGQMCSVETCEQAAKTKGLCRFHYQRHISGLNLAAPRTDPRPALRFLNEVIKAAPECGCVLWPYSKYGNGYGRVVIDGRTQMTHRVVCLRVHGEPPSPAHEVAHNCGNPSCIAPHHVRWATHVENCADRILHGTSNRGERHGNSKLTREAVVSIRQSVVRGEKAKDLAMIHGVEAKTIRKIVRGESWAWLT